MNSPAINKTTANATYEAVVKASIKMLDEIPANESFIYKHDWSLPDLCAVALAINAGLLKHTNFPIGTRAYHGISPNHHGIFPVIAIHHETPGQALVFFAEKDIETKRDETGVSWTENIFNNLNHHTRLKQAFSEAFAAKNRRSYVPVSDSFEDIATAKAIKDWLTWVLLVLGSKKVIFDELACDLALMIHWCYEELGISTRANYLDIFEKQFKDMPVNAEEFVSVFQIKHWSDKITARLDVINNEQIELRKEIRRGSR